MVLVYGADSEISLFLPKICLSHGARAAVPKTISAFKQQKKKQNWDANC